MEADTVHNPRTEYVIESLHMVLSSGYLDAGHDGTLVEVTDNQLNWNYLPEKNKSSWDMYMLLS